MVRNTSGALQSYSPAQAWGYRFEFPGELAFLIQR